MAPSIPIWEYSANHPNSVQTFLYSDLPGITLGWTRNSPPAFYAFDKDHPGVVPVFRYQAGGQATDPQRYQYTSEDNPDFPGWKFDGTVFYAFMTPQPDTVPLYKYSATNPQRERCSTNSSLDTTWHRNATFYVPRS